MYLVSTANYILIAVLKVVTDGTLEVLSRQTDLEVVFVFCTPHGHEILVVLEGHGLAFGRAYYQLTAVHEVKHDVFEARHERFSVDLVEVYFFIGGHLHPIHSLHMV